MTNMLCNIMYEDNHYDRQKETPPDFCTTTRVSRTGPPDRPAPFSKLVLLPCFFSSKLVQLPCFLPMIIFNCLHCLTSMINFSYVTPGRNHLSCACCCTPSSGKSGASTGLSWTLTI